MHEERRLHKKKYPRRFMNDTQTGDDGYPVYRRRNTGNGGRSTTLQIRGNMVHLDKKIRNSHNLKQELPIPPGILRLRAGS
ncbi:hypothetical protein J6590_075909 [Homalodisca vitripennis]|nr:hypothetical protein J6590_075909 [Homalodisca vitripennis]